MLCSKTPSLALEDLKLKAENEMTWVSWGSEVMVFGSRRRTLIENNVKGFCQGAEEGSASIPISVDDWTYFLYYMLQKLRIEMVASMDIGVNVIAPSTLYKEMEIWARWNEQQRGLRYGEDVCLRKSLDHPDSG